MVPFLTSDEMRLWLNPWLACTLSTSIGGDAPSAMSVGLCCCCCCRWCCCCCCWWCPTCCRNMSWPPMTSLLCCGIWKVGNDGMEGRWLSGGGAEFGGGGMWRPWLLLLLDCCIPCWWWICTNTWTFKGVLEIFDENRIQNYNIRYDRKHRN